MDDQVKLSQQYLNTTYGSRSGYQRVPENGLTGWPTTFGIIRALQIELGITALSDSFGPATEAAFNLKVGSVSSKTSSTQIVSLLQCALWCKGKPGGTVGSGWTSTVAASVTGVKLDMGLGVNALSADVPLKVMKSLLTMDAYTKLPGGSDMIRAGQQWLNGKYSIRASFYISPCDGLFTRQTQQAILYALQYELGMNDATANGNFGSQTKAGIKAKAVVANGSRDVSTSFVRLYQLLLACNAYPAAFDGTFSSSTYSSTRDFQGFMELPVNGKGDFSTWAALLVSTGDTDIAATAFDTSTPLTADFAASRFKEGYRIAGRYLTVESKSIKARELDTIFNAGLALLPVFQAYNNAASFFTEAEGRNHGRQAGVRARQLGIKPGAMIFFAVDYGATGEEANSIVLDYFRGVNAAVNASDTIYTVGVYATRNVASIVTGAKLALGVWVSGMSTGYSGNLGFKMPTLWMYNQIQELATINIDRNVVSKRARPVQRSDVDATPLIGGSRYNNFYWYIVALQFSIEEDMKARGIPATSNLAADTLLFGLSRINYDSPAFNGYIFAIPPNVDLAVGTALTAVQNKVKYSYIKSDHKPNGDYEVLATDYDGGDVSHMAATAMGVLRWGDVDGRAELMISDFGGWGLDMVSFWANFKGVWEPRGVSIAEYGRQLGAEVGTGVPTLPTWQTVTGFGRSDLIADADGYLIAREIRKSGCRADEAFRRLLVAYPRWEARVAAFISARFGSTPDAMRSTFGWVMRSLFVQKNIFEYFPEYQFMIYSREDSDVVLRAPEPTAAELEAFIDACATRLVSLATSL
ncbi:glycoside hydrolase domain-containing protein [Clavibacter michiganensis]|uniref:glycoside hydrolase domain-containing protein n=1 Tax=Clavibacter michiganensis TaxID=28447 RepID=UPI0029315F87|nr:glycoside hydrolase domain-containing protein [Clavibacter michiganensis]